MVLSKEDILKCDDLKRELVKVPECGGDLYVRTMSGKERDQFEAKFVAANGNSEVQLNNIRARMAVLTVCDDKGIPLFSNGDALELGKKSAAALDRVFEVSQRLNKIGDDDVEKLVKN